MDHAPGSRANQTTAVNAVQLDMVEDAASVRILLVGGEDADVHTVVSALNELGYTIAGSMNSYETAIREAASLQPDLVLLDVAGDSDSDGLQAAQNVRQAHDIPVICLTAHSDEPASFRDWLRQPVTSLAKPFRVSDLRDVIEISLFKHQMERRLRESEELRETRTSEAVAHLAAGVAHVFNNLLTVILGHAELLSPDLADHEFLARASKIRDAARQAAKVTRQLTVVARRQTPTPQLLDLNDILRETFQSLSQELAAKGIECSVVSAAEPAYVELDPVQLQEIMQALVTNAVEAMPNGGKLAVRIDFADLRQDDHSHRSNISAGRYLVLELSDTGSGMSPEIRSRLFEPFFSTKAFGHGLGLAVVYGIVKQNGGSISANSEPGKGSTFKIHLPRAKTETAMPLPTEDLLCAEGQLVPSSRPRPKLSIVANRLK